MPPLLLVRCSLTGAITFDVGMFTSSRFTASAVGLSVALPLPLVWPNELSGVTATPDVASASKAALSRPTRLRSSDWLCRISRPLSLVLLSGDGTCVEAESSECRSLSDGGVEPYRRGDGSGVRIGFDWLVTFASASPIVRRTSFLY